MNLYWYGLETMDVPVSLSVIELHGNKQDFNAHNRSAAMGVIWDNCMYMFDFDTLYKAVKLVKSIQVQTKSLNTLLQVNSTRLSR